MRGTLVYTLVLPDERPPSLNELWAGKWKHRQRSEESRRMHAVVKYAEMNAPFEGVLTYPVFLVFRVYEAKRRIDHSNYVVKSYEDSLVTIGILKNDSPKYVVGGATLTFVDVDNPRVEIDIYNVYGDSLADTDIHMVSAQK